MRIAVAQIATRAGDLERTGERIVEQSERAAEQGVELLVFPVATLTGPFALPPADQRGLLMDVTDLLIAVARRVACPCLVPIVMMIGDTASTEVFLLAGGDAVPLRFESMMRTVFGGGATPRTLAGEGGFGEDALGQDLPGGVGADELIAELEAAFGETFGEGLDGLGEGMDDVFGSNLRGALEDLLSDWEDELGGEDEGEELKDDELGDEDDLYADIEGHVDEFGRPYGDYDDDLGGLDGDGADELEEARFTSLVVGGLRLVLACGFDDLYELVDYDYEFDAAIFLPALGFAADEPARALGAGLAESEFRQDMRMCGAWLVAAGSLGVYDSSVYTGGSFVLSPAGELMAAAPSFEEALIVVDIAGAGEAAGGQSTAVAGAEAGAAGATPLALHTGPLEPEVYDRQFFLWQALAFGLREYVHNLGRTDVALTLDGTLGSCALAVLACDALGPTHVHALLATPLIGTSLAKGRAKAKGSAAWRQVVEAARRERSCRRLAANLRLELVERDERLAGVTATLLEDAYAESERLAVADLEAGVMRSELARLAATTGSLTLSAHDKTWLALEARANDAGADLLPFGELYRTDVLELARMRNVISPVVPDLTPLACDMPCLELEESECTRPPERPGSRGTGTPADLGLLHVADVMLAGRLEWGYSVSELTETHKEEDLVLAVLAQVERHAPARVAAGVALHVGGTSIEADRTPYAMAWHDVARPDAPMESEEFLESLRQAALARFGSAEGDGPSDAPEPHRAGGQASDSTDILSYLRDLADELGVGPGGAGSFDGHIATDGEGHYGFGGFPDGNPFSEN